MINWDAVIFTVGFVIAFAMVASILIWPFVIYSKMETLNERVFHLQGMVDALDDFLNGEGPDDPDDGEPEPVEHSNVIAIGKRAA